MLQENRELQESEVSDGEIQVFVSMLRRNPMHPLFLDLLRATCECSGQAINQNQLRVSEWLLQKKENRGLLLSLHSRAVPGRGGSSPRPTVELVATWSCESHPGLSPMSLFGKLEVPLVEMFDANSAARPISPSKKPSSLSYSGPPTKRLSSDL